MVALSLAYTHATPLKKLLFWARIKFLILCEVGYVLHSSQYDTVVFKCRAKVHPILLTIYLVLVVVNMSCRVLYICSRCSLVFVIMFYGQIYECSDEASDDWYWLYAAVAFDDIPMTVISNDRTRH